MATVTTPQNPEPYPKTRVQHGSTAAYDSPSVAAILSNEVARLNDLIDKSMRGGDPVVSGYKLFHAIGSGNFGTVWEAQHENTDERVAIKFFVNRQASDAILKEVRNLASLQGQANVIPIKDVRIDGVPPLNLPYCVMTYAAGGSLQELVRREGTTEVPDTVRGWVRRRWHRPVAKTAPKRLPAADAVRIIRAITRTLAFVHAKGIVHSDLKLANVLLNEAGQPLLADFGQAQRHGRSSGQGTLFYMAPERATIQRLDPDPRWDVYSLGAMLYALLTGNLPRQSDDLQRRLDRQTTIPDLFETYQTYLPKQPKPVAHHAYCDRGLAAIIDRCLALNPEDRPADAGVLLTQLEANEHNRRLRPVRRAGVAAVALFLALSGLGVWLANGYLAEQKQKMELAVQDALKQKTHLAAQIVEDRLGDRVWFVEYHTNDAVKCPDAVRSTLIRVRDRMKEEVAAREGRSLPEPGKAIHSTDRDTLDNWLGGSQPTSLFAELDRIYPQVRKSLALHVAVPSRKDHAASYSYLLSRTEGEFLNDTTTADGKTVKGRITPREDRIIPGNNDLYYRNWAYRDYFNGTGNKYAADREDPKSLPYPPIRTTHISEVYLSAAKATVAGQPDVWKVDIATPIWDTAGVAGTDAPREVIGLLVCGISVDQDLQHDLFFREDAKETTDASTEFVITNEARRWVVHGQPHRDALRKDGKQVRDVESYDNCRNPVATDLADIVARERIDTLSIPRHLSTMTSTLAPIGVPDYIDTMKPDAKEHIAAVNPFEPYRFSAYYKTKPVTEQPRKWLLIAQMDRDKVADQMRGIRDSLVIAGGWVFAGLAVIAIGMWGWLYHATRRGGDIATV